MHFFTFVSRSSSFISSDRVSVIWLGFIVLSIHWNVFKTNRCTKWSVAWTKRPNVERADRTWEHCPCRTLSCLKMLNSCMNTSQWRTWYVHYTIAFRRLVWTTRVQQVHNPQIYQQTYRGVPLQYGQFLRLTAYIRTFSWWNFVQNPHSPGFGGGSLCGGYSVPHLYSKTVKCDKTEPFPAISFPVYCCSFNSVTYKVKGSPYNRPLRSRGWKEV